jgi:hypothetical protein
MREFMNALLLNSGGSFISDASFVALKRIRARLSPPTQPSLLAGNWNGTFWPDSDERELTVSLDMQTSGSMVTAEASLSGLSGKEPMQQRIRIAVPLIKDGAIVIVFCSDDPHQLHQGCGSGEVSTCGRVIAGRYFSTGWTHGRGITSGRFKVWHQSAGAASH